MAENKNSTINLITQVNKEDVANSNANSTPQRRGVFSTICCCFLSRERKEELKDEDPRKDLALEPVSDGGFLLQPQSPDVANQKTLVLDLDETLVHSSFKPIPNPDFIIPVEIEDQVHKVYVVKRPGVDQFLHKMGEKFEVVVFTASLAKYADPVLDLLDTTKVVKARLFREACSNYKGNYVKDLNRLGRELKNTVIIDNSPSSYLFHQEYAIGCETWFDDENDTELMDMIPFLESMAKCDNVKVFLEHRRKDGKIQYRP